MQHRIVGSTMPVLEFALEPGESVISESGEISWMLGDIQMRTATAVGGQGAAGQAGGVASQSSAIATGNGNGVTTVTVSQTGGSGGGSARRSGPGRRAGTKDADTLGLENDLAEVLGLKVEILDREGAGELRIHYLTLEQLDDVCRRLTGG